jgi:hypothetical protein
VNIVEQVLPLVFLSAIALRPKNPQAAREAQVLLVGSTLFCVLVEHRGFYLKNPQQQPNRQR